MMLMLSVLSDVLSENPDQARRDTLFYLRIIVEAAKRLPAMPNQRVHHSEKDSDFFLSLPMDTSHTLIGGVWQPQLWSCLK